VGSRVHTSETILIVEDDRETAQGLSEMLQLLGYRTAIAENGRVALDRLRDAPGQYCLVLLDLMMPVMDGWTFLTEQRGDGRIGKIPVVLVTAAWNAQAKAAQTGAVAVLPKPVDPDKLEATLRRFC
jgi:CheY-like chemotaxis protein